MSATILACFISLSGVHGDKGTIAINVINILSISDARRLHCPNGTLVHTAESQYGTCVKESVSEILKKIKENCG